MKKKRINRVIIRRQNELLEKAGISGREELLDMSVADLIRQIGNGEIDLLLERLFICLVCEESENISSIPLDLAEGHQYVIDIFESNGFDINLEWFYDITVKEFLELEDLKPNKIPFLTYYLKRYVELEEMSEPEYLSLYDGNEEKYLFYINMEEAR